jgi:hypothetical protein
VEGADTRAGHPARTGCQVFFSVAVNSTQRKPSKQVRLYQKLCFEEKGTMMRVTMMRVTKVRGTKMRGGRQS